MVPVSNGIVDPKHYRSMRESIWMFYYLLDKQTRGVDSDGNGKVLGGKPIRDSDIAAAFGVSIRTVRRMRDRLFQFGYVTARRTPYGYVYAITKPKKWKDKTGERSDKSVLSLTSSEGRDRTQTVGRSDRCVRNKEDVTGPYSSSSTKTPTAAVSQEQMGKELETVWNYYLEAFDKQEILSPSAREKGMAVLSELHTLGHSCDVCVTTMQCAIDVAHHLVTTQQKKKAFFSNWFAIFGKWNTFVSLHQQWNENIPESATIELSPLG